MLLMSSADGNNKVAGIASQGADGTLPPDSVGMPSQTVSDSTQQLAADATVVSSEPVGHPGGPEPGKALSDQTVLDQRIVVPLLTQPEGPLPGDTLAVHQPRLGADSTLVDQDRVSALADFTIPENGTLNQSLQATGAKSASPDQTHISGYESADIGDTCVESAEESTGTLAEEDALPGHAASAGRFEKTLVSDPPTDEGSRSVGSLSTRGETRQGDDGNRNTAEIGSSRAGLVGARADSPAQTAVTLAEGIANSGSLNKTISKPTGIDGDPTPRTEIPNRSDSDLATTGPEGSGASPIRGGKTDISDTRQVTFAFSVPDHELIKELGKGAMGVVYKARQTGLNRVVALKMILNAEFAGSQAVARFNGEAQSVAAVDHPNIIKVYQVGNFAGKPFLSMEFVPGGSLDSRIGESPQDPMQSARLVAQIARGLAHVHRKGIVHRDLKPANILLAGPEGEDLSIVPLGLLTAKVGDFGLVKRIDDDSSRTRDGAIMGTPSYMAPEQAKGLNQEVGPAADIYGIGGILYDLLTGSPPFRGASVMNTIQQVINREPVSPRQLVDAVPADLATICLKCLEKDPARRYATADALADDLEAFLEHRPIVARPAGWWERSWKWCRRNPAPAVAIAAVSALLVALAGAGGLAATAYRARSEADKAAAEAANIQSAKDKADAENAQKQSKLAMENLEAAERNARDRAENLARALANATSEALGDLWRQVDAIESSGDLNIRELMAGRLRQQAESAGDPVLALRSALALAPRDKAMAVRAALGVSRFEPGAMDATIDRVRGSRESFLESYWRQLADKPDSSTSLRLAAVLAKLEPTDARWAGVAGTVADSLARLGPADMERWLMHFSTPAMANRLAPRLEELFIHPSDPTPEQPSGFEPAAFLLNRLAQNRAISDPRLMARMVVVGTPSQFRVLWPSVAAMGPPLADALSVAKGSSGASGAADWVAGILPPQAAVRMAAIDAANDKVKAEAEREAKRLVCLARLGRPEPLVLALSQVAEPDLRSMLFVYAPALLLPADKVNAWRKQAANPVARMNLILTLGQYPTGDGDGEIAEALRKEWGRDLVHTDLRHPSAGVHAAAAWLARRWLKAEPPVVLPDMTISLPPGHPTWIHDKWVGDMTVVPAGLSFSMGAAPYDKSRSIEGRIDLEARHVAGSDRRYAIAQQEVTLKRFKECVPGHKSVGMAVDAAEDLPVNAVSWLDAVHYCQELSRRSSGKGIYPAYPPAVDLEWREPSGNPVKFSAELVSTPGYRLPTEAEWEMAARGGITTPFPSGRGDSLLGGHAHTSANSGGRLQPVGKLLPGAWGLFDACGNAAEWTMTELLPYEGLRQGVVVERAYRPVAAEVGKETFMVIRGGSMANNPLQARFSSRLAVKPDTRAASVGFRVCRTLPDAGAPSSQMDSKP